jgi:hypothetical protein
VVWVLGTGLGVTAACVTGSVEAAGGGGVVAAGWQAARRASARLEASRGREVRGAFMGRSFGGG